MGVPGAAREGTGRPVTLALETDEAGQRLLLGVGVRHQLATVLADLGVRAPLVLASSSSTALAQRLAEPFGAGRVRGRARSHVPAELVSHTVDDIVELGADGLVSVGGGAATGLAKGAALRTGLPVVAVPTTLAGSEATPVWGLTEDGRKRTGRDPAVQPRVVLADPEALRAVAPRVLAASGLNAIAHAAAAYSGTAQSPLSRLLAADGARRLLRALPAGVGRSLAGLAQSLYGAQLTARGFALAGSGPHHRMCHALGGAFDLPHAATHAALLPHTLAALPPAVLADLSRDLGQDDLPAAVADLARAVDAPTSLEAQGLQAADLERAADLAAEAAGAGASAERVRSAVAAAHAGDHPHGK